MMEKLISLLCLKVNAEYKQFKLKQLQRPVEEVYNNSYEINIYTCLFETILEMSQMLSEKQLVNLINTPDLLAFLYENWLRVEDSAQDELEAYLKREIMAQNNWLNRKEVAI